jgi:hypothetical protein
VACASRLVGNPPRIDSSAEITSYKPLKTNAPLLAQSSNVSPHGMGHRFTRHELALAEEVRDCVHQIDVSH